MSANDLGWVWGPPLPSIMIPRAVISRLPCLEQVYMWAYVSVCKYMLACMCLCIRVVLGSMCIYLWEIMCKCVGMWAYESCVNVWVHVSVGEKVCMRVCERQKIGAWVYVVMCECIYMNMYVCDYVRGACVWGGVWSVYISKCAV